MWIITQGEKSTEIKEDVIRRVLSLYPEEELESRPIFKKAFNTGKIKFEELKQEADRILIPWQMFLLTEENLNAQMKHIEEQRIYKVSSKLIAKRKGAGEVTSKRIIDRLIRQQNFVVSQKILNPNKFCGSLKGLQIKSAVNKILASFEIDYTKLWQFTSKGKGLEYLIGCIESNNINISRGVLTNKILPTWQVVPNNIYKNTSGFVIRDEFIPFIFLPNETNPDEVESRQIYTLIYLLAVIGLEQYEYFLEKDFKAKMTNAKGMNNKLHNITSELLMPRSETNKFKGKKLTIKLRDSLASKFKVSPLALITTLKIRGVISNDTFQDLKPEPFKPTSGSTNRRSPKITTSVKKFCGQISYNLINEGIRNGSLSSIQSQYLIFGSVNKKGYLRYRKELNL